MAIQLYYFLIVCIALIWTSASDVMTYEILPGAGPHPLSVDQDKTLPELNLL